MANGFEIPSQAAAQGLLTGAQTGLQFAQLAEQKRQAKWEQGYKKAALSVQTAALLKDNPTLQSNVLNNGFLPLWNDPDFDVAGNNKTPFEPFKPEDMQDKALQDLIQKSREKANDKELAKNPELQARTIADLWMIYHGQRGNIAEAQKLALGMTKGDTGTPTFVGTTSEGSGVYFDPKTKTFGVSEIPGGGPLTPKAVVPTDAQANAATFATRAGQANQQIQNLRATGFDTAGLRGGAEALLPNVVQSSGTQQYGQAKRNFLSAVLRKESGAVISKDEMREGDKQYFDQAGDSPEVSEQKALNRMTAIEGLSRASGPFKKDLKNPSAPATSAKPKTIQQSGHIYTLNEQTGEYE